MIWFNVRQALNQLLKHGEVYTLRPKKRREGIEPLFSKFFPQKSKGDRVLVKFVKKITKKEDLIPFVAKSGFSSIDEWLQKAGEASFLYYVRLLPKGCFFCPRCGKPVEFDPTTFYHCNPEAFPTRRKFGFLCYTCKATIFVREDGKLDVILHGEKLGKGRYIEGETPKYQMETGEVIQNGS